MSFASYSATPASNTTIAGQSVAEGTTAPGTLNLAVRTLMADGRELFDLVDAIDLSSYAGLAGPAFTAQPTYSGRGGFLYHSNSANATGRVYVQAEAAATPSLNNGDILLLY